MSPCSKHLVALLDGRVSCVRLFATPWTVACQAPLSLGSTRQECWSGLPSPSPLPSAVGSIGVKHLAALLGTEQGAGSGSWGECFILSILPWWPFNLPANARTRPPPPPAPHLKELIASVTRLPSLTSFPAPREGH